MRTAILTMILAALATAGFANEDRATDRTKQKSSGGWTGREMNKHLSAHSDGRFDLIALYQLPPVPAKQVRPGTQPGPSRSVCHKCTQK